MDDRDCGIVPCDALVLGLTYQFVDRRLTDWDEVDPVFESGTMRVRAVAVDSPLANAGLRIGDRVLAIGGFPIREARDWKLALDNLQVGRTQLGGSARPGTAGPGHYSRKKCVALAHPVVRISVVRPCITWSFHRFPAAQ